MSAKAKRLEAHISVIARIECHVCGDTTEAMETSLSDLPESIMRFYALGWRELTSRKYQTRCAMCPTCARAKDSNR